MMRFGSLGLVLVLGACVKLTSPLPPPPHVLAPESPHQCARGMSFFLADLLDENAKVPCPDSGAGQ